MATTLTIDAFEALRELISRRSGIVVPANKCASLEIKLADHLAELGVRDFNQYVQRLSAEAAGSPIWHEVYRRVSTNETFFFRNSAQTKAFSEVLLPGVLAQQEKKLFKRIKVWSAACSTGEEPYTLAMQLTESLGADLGQWQPQILATDIDAEVVRTATAGNYSGRALTNVPRTYLLRHFEENGDGSYSVVNALRSMIKFQVLNFADDAQMGAQTNFDIVYCRNVLIYFDAEFRKRVVSHLFNALKPSGFLVIGHSESLRDIHNGFECIRFPGTLIYQRPEA